MPRRAGLLVSTLLACCGGAFALDPTLDIDQYAHKAWTIREGVFNAAINSIVQTPDGYLWLGTEFGLLRFDGVQKTAWQPPEGQRLPSNWIRALLVSRDGRLWIGTNAGLASWKDGKLTQYPELAGQVLLSLVEDREGTVWAGTYESPSGRLCAIQTGGVKCYGEDGSFGSAVHTLYEDSQGSLWAGSQAGLWRWKPGPPKFFSVPDAVQGLIEGDNGALLIATVKGLYRLVSEKVEAYSIPGAAGQFRGLLRDRNGGLWIGTNDRGLFHVHQGRAGSFTQSGGLSGDTVQRLFEDREGNIWAGTTDGLDRFRDFAVPTISVKQGLSNATVVSVLAARDGSVWLGTLDGLNRWKDGQVTIFRKRTNGLPDDWVDSLFEDDRGRILVSTRSGMAWFENGRFTPLSGVPTVQVHTIAGDNAGNLWIGGDEAMLHLSQGKLVEQIPWSRLGHKELATSLLTDSAGGLWMGFVLGGVEYFKDGQVRASYSEPDGLGAGGIGNFQLDRDGTLWAATAGGLGHIKDGHIAALSSKNGLPCDAVHWVMEDDDHSTWLYTSCGLVRIARSELDAWVADPKRTIQATVFDTSDGVRSHPRPSSYYSPNVSKSTDGKLWFAGWDGVSVVDPRHLPDNKLPPSVDIEEMIADRKTYWNSISAAASNLRLPALTRDLEIEYTALSLVAPEKNRYRVKLEGWDRDWIEMGNERKKFYGNLPPRSYRFRVMASNNSGMWNETGAALDFGIAPAYYQTRRFQGLCGIAGLALLWGLYRLRLYQLAREFNLRLDERVNERTRLARDLHDTLLQSFQGLMLRLQVIDDQIPPGKLKDQLEQTLERADQAIAEGRSAVYDLRSSTTTTNDLAQALREVGNELAAPDGTATFRLVVEGPSRDLHPIIRDEIYRISREALRNAFTHARAHHIEAELIYADRQFQLRIRDDGQGIASEILEEGRPGHYGLPGMRERAKQIGAKLTIWSGASNGTEIELSIDGSIAYGGRLRSVSP